LPNCISIRGWSFKLFSSFKWARIGIKIVCRKQNIQFYTVLYHRYWLSHQTEHTNSFAKLPEMISITRLWLDDSYPLHRPTNDKKWFFPKLYAVTTLNYNYQHLNCSIKIKNFNFKLILIRRFKYIDSKLKSLLIVGSSCQTKIICLPYNISNGKLQKKNKGYYKYYFIKQKM
jgi:hypothetical protein